MRNGIENIDQWRAFDAILRYAPGGVFVYSAEEDEEFSFVSDNMLSMLGYTLEEFRRKFDNRFSHMVYVEDREATLKTIWEQIAVGPFDTCFYRIEKADGSLLWVHDEGHIVTDERGKRWFYVVIVDTTRTMHTQDELEHRNQELQALIDSIPVRVIVFRRRGGHTGVEAINGYMSEYAKVRYASLRKMNLEELRALVHPDDRAAVINFFRQLYSGREKQVEITYRSLMDEEDSYLWFHCIGVMTPQSDGSQLIYCTYTDVTSQMQKEEEFNRILQGLLTANPNSLCTFHLNLTKNVCSDGHGASKYIRQLLDARTADGLLEKIASIITNRADAERFRRDFCRVRLLEQFSQGEGRLSTIYRRFTDGGTSHWVTTYFHMLRNPFTDDVEAIAYSVDSDRSHQEEEIIDHLTNTKFDLIAELDSRRGTVEFLHKRGSLDFVRLHEKVKYENWLEHVAQSLVPAAGRDEYLHNSSLGKVVEKLEQNVEYAFACQQILKGEERRYQVQYSWLEREEGRVLFVLTDVTTAYNLEQARIEELRTALASAEQASVAKTEFLSRMSHEIRTPMNAIIGLDAIALEENGLTATGKDYLRKIGVSAHFLLSLINDILDMSRIESGKMVLQNEAFKFGNFIDSINTIMDEQCRANNLDYECVLESCTEDYYVGDRTKLQQVLINILGNSVKFTPKGGKIRFLVEQTGRTRTKAKLRFVISDTGIGIDEAFLPHMFEAFSQENRGRTSEYGGTGLGLAISSNLVRLMNGQIAVHSTKGVGSEFTVEVELLLPEKAVRRQEKIGFGYALPRCTLIVSDDEIASQHVKQLLTAAGLKAECVASEDCAAERLAATRQSGGSYELLLLDAKTPNMGTLETARRLRKCAGAELAIIVMSAHDWAGMAEQAQAAGVDMFTQKPVLISSLSRAFEEASLKKRSCAPLAGHSEYDFSGKRVLLAEDNEINAEIAKRMLEMKHCTVDVAENGVAALDAFSGHPVGYYNAILMDVRMPLMDGLEATRTIRGMKRADAQTIPILAMTANAFQEDVDATLQSGMNAHMAKPIEPRMLYETLCCYLFGQTPRSRGAK